MWKPRDQRVSGHDGLHMCQEIFLGTRGPAKGRYQLSRHDVTAQDKATRSMTLILEFASLHMARCQREPGMLTFYCLHAGQLVGTHRALALLGQARRLPIHCTDGPDGFLALRILRWCEPVADQMRFEIPFFNRREACRGEMYWIIPRCIISSAISRPVQ